MFFRMVYKSVQIFLPFCHNPRVWQTDGRTEISSQYRGCITCSAVIIIKLHDGCVCTLRWPVGLRWTHSGFALAMRGYCFQSHLSACLSACPSVRNALHFESLDLGSSCLVYTYIFRIYIVYYANKAAQNHKSTVK